MLGWNIYIRINIAVIGNEELSANPEYLLAKWTAGLGGLDWADELVKEEKAICLKESTGYPTVYVSSVENILSKIKNGPPNHKGPLVVGEDYFTPSGWVSEFEINQDRFSQCSPGTIVLIEAWDLS